MTDREIVIYLAEKVMGWSVGDAGRERLGMYPRLDFYTYHELPRLHSDGKHCRIWNPLENIADAFEVQAAFLYLGPNKRRRFTQSLNRIAWNENSPGFGRDWAMVGATARQRCLAIVEATK